MAVIGIAGLGSMGFGMATSCVAAGHDCYGFDVNTDAVARFVDEGGKGDALADIAPKLDALCIVVLNAEQTASVIDTALHHMRPGAVILGCATIPPGTANALAARVEAAGVFYLDAPISGGAVKAAAGALSVMASGSAAAFAAAKPALDAVAETVFELGPEAGAGSAMKAVNQLLAGVHIAAMAEAMALGMSQGISPAQFMSVIPSCAGTSWMLENRGPHVVDGDYTPRSQVNIWPKDLGIVQETAGRAGLSTPITDAALAQYLSAREKGLGAVDDAAVIRVYAEEIGLTLPGDVTGDEGTQS